MKQDNSHKWQYLGLVGEYSSCPEESSEEVAGWFKDFPDFRRIDIIVHNWASEPVIKAGFLEEQLKKNIPKNDGGKILSVTGHGEWHFLTYGLCRLADRQSKNYGYIHIDHHCDSWRKPREALFGKMNCGSFVPFILERTNATEFIFLGTDIQLENDSNWCDALGRLKQKGKSLTEDLESGMFDLASLENILGSIECDDVYVSFDLDVMSESDILTGYHGFDAGVLKRKSLLDSARLIKRKKNIIGADINGYSNSQTDINASLGWRYGDDELNELMEKSKKLYLDIARIITE